MLLLLGALSGGFVSGLVGFGTAMTALGIWLYVLPPSMAVPLVLICSVMAGTSTMPSMWRGHQPDAGLAVPDRRPCRLAALGVLLIAYADPQVFKLRHRHAAAGVSDRIVLPAQTDGVHVGRSGRGWRRLDLPAASSAAWPACPERFRHCGRAYAAGARTRAARRFPRPSTGRSCSPPCACRPAWGLVQLDVVWLALIAFPATITGAWLGARAYRALSDRNFRDLVLALLFLSGVGLVWSSIGVR